MKLKEEIVYLNGSLVPRSKAHISVFDYGFLYGGGLFETMRAYRGQIFLLERHLARLLDASSITGFVDRLNKAELEKACEATLAANSLKDARLRLTVSRGEAGPFPGVSQKPTVLVTASSYSPPPLEKYDRGFRAGVASFRQFSQSPIARLKSLSYLLNLMARLETGAAGLDECLLLNERGLITEGSVSNIFFVTAAGTLITPSLDCGLLPGVTRQIVIEMAGSSGIKVIEGEVRLKDLEDLSEAFLTNSMMEIMPVVAVRDSDGRTITIGSGKPGVVTQKLMAAYREMVKRETSHG